VGKTVGKPVIVLHLQSDILPLACALFPQAACGVVFTSNTTMGIRTEKQAAAIKHLKKGKQIKTTGRHHL
jgi:hypothetical protein